MNDKDLIAYATDFRTCMIGAGASNMKGWLICSPLNGLLTVVGFDSQLMEGKVGETHHFWIELGDGRVLDPTADQFNGLHHAPVALPPVYLGPPTMIHVRQTPSKISRHQSAEERQHQAVSAS